MGLFTDFVCNIALEAIKEKCSDKVDNHAINQQIRKYISLQQSRYYNASFDEEVDFDGLALYIQANLSSELSQYIWGDDEQRAHSYLEIIHAAERFAKGEKSLVQTRKMLNESLKIIRRFFRSKVGKDTLLIANEIKDSLKNSVHEEGERIIKKMHAGASASQLLSLDSNVQAAREGDLAHVEKNLSSFVSCISSTHTLSPYYGYKYNEDSKLISVPLSKEAVDKYPPRIQMDITSVKVGESFHQDSGRNLFDYAYRHQQPISFDIVMAKKLLGNVLDPQQVEAQELIGAHALMMPPKFPPARPFSISLDDTVYFDYILLGAKEIHDNGDFVITNEVQENSSAAITLLMNFETKQASFSYSLKNKTVENAIKCREFSLAASSGGRFSIKDLSTGTIFAAGNVESFEPDEYISASIVLLKKLHSIEQYYHVQLVLPDEITQSDYQNIDYLFTLIKDGAFSGVWKDFAVSIEITKESRAMLQGMTDSNYAFVGCCQQVVTLFGEDITFYIQRQMLDGKIDNYERFTKRIELFNDGETFILKMVQSNPNTGSKYIDWIISEEEYNNPPYLLQSQPNRAKSD